jgi:cbb3-type cytochrome oxidase cytochrome c subunit
MSRTFNIRITVPTTGGRITKAAKAAKSKAETLADEVKDHAEETKAKTRAAVAAYRQEVPGKS